MCHTQSSGCDFCLTGNKKTFKSLFGSKESAVAIVVKMVNLFDMFSLDFLLIKIFIQQNIWCQT